MPTYSFKCECGQTQEINRPMSEATKPVSCVICKKRMNRDFANDFGKQLHGDIYPYNSYSLGVSESEIPEMMEFDRRNGVETTYNRDGEPEMRSPRHRRAYAEAHGFFDRNAGYSDPCPKHK